MSFGIFYFLIRLLVAGYGSKNDFLFDVCFHMTGTNRTKEEGAGSIARRRMQSIAVKSRTALGLTAQQQATRSSSDDSHFCFQCVRSAVTEATSYTLSVSRLGGVLATGPKGRGFKPGQGDVFLRAIKIRSTPSSRMGSKAGGSHVIRFYGMLKNS
jgi:hypothetical protein